MGAFLNTIAEGIQAIANPYKSQLEMAEKPKVIKEGSEKAVELMKAVTDYKVLEKKSKELRKEAGQVKQRVQDLNQQEGKLNEQFASLEIERRRHEQNYQMASKQKRECATKASELERQRLENQITALAAGFLSIFTEKIEPSAALFSDLNKKYSLQSYLEFSSKEECLIIKNMDPVINYISEHHEVTSLDFSCCKHHIGDLGKLARFLARKDCQITRVTINIPGEVQPFKVEEIKLLGDAVFERNKSRKIFTLFVNGVTLD